MQRLHCLHKQILALLVLSAALMFGTSVTAQKGNLSWREDLSAIGGDVLNVMNTPDGLTLGDEGTRQSVYGIQRSYGVYTLPVRTLNRPVNRLRPTLKAELPAGAEALVEVRVRTIGGSWSEWFAATADAPALMPQSGSEVQARLTLIDDGFGDKPIVKGLRFVADTVDAPDTTLQAQAAASLTYTIFATREGLVGGTTANGHIIKTNDRFVALPSRRALSSNGGTEYIGAFVLP
ncbi:MAG: hypothetical protein WKF71_01845 [Pyrinomonadaceae bacterium]